MIRAIGAKFENFHKEKSLVKIEKHPLNDEILFSVTYKTRTTTITLQQVLTLILSHILEPLKSRFGQQKFSAIVSVPNMFNSFQRFTIQNACSAAGLEVLRLVNHTTGSAITYCLEQPVDKAKNVLMFDMGATTLNVGVLEICGTKVTAKATGGDLNLGGADFDQVIVEYFENDVQGDAVELAGLRCASENIKKMLTTTEEATEQLTGRVGAEPLNIKLSRDRLERQCDHLFEKIKEVVMETIDSADLEVEEIDEVVIVGKVGCMPKIRKCLREIFIGKELLNQNESCVKGVAYFVNRKGHLAIPFAVQKLEVQDVNSISLTLQQGDGSEICLVDSDDAIPVRKKFKFKQPSSKLCRFLQEKFLLHEQLYESKSLEICVEMNSSELLDIKVKIPSEPHTKILNHIPVDTAGVKVLSEQVEKLKREDETGKLLTQMKREIADCCSKYAKNFAEKDLKEKLDDQVRNVVNAEYKKFLKEVAHQYFAEQSKLKIFASCEAEIENYNRHSAIKRLLVQADAEEQRQEFEKASQTYTDLINLMRDENPTFDGLQRSKAMFSLKKYEQAVSDCNEVLKLNADDLQKPTKSGPNHISISIIWFYLPKIAIMC